MLKNLKYLNEFKTEIIGLNKSDYSIKQIACYLQEYHSFSIPLKQLKDFINNEKKEIKKVKV